MNPLISIIVPIYNVESYLKRCVESLRSQTYPNIEIILVDDGSPDNCGKICDEYSNIDQRIKVVHKPNGGLSDARNAGLDVAKGDLIGFVDSDDFIHPQMYEILYKNMADYNADVSLCNFELVYNDTKIFSEIINKPQVFSGTEALDKIFTYWAQIFVISWDKLYKRAFFDSIRFPKGKIHEDEFTSYKIYAQSKRIVFTDTKLYYYFQSDNSIVRSSFSEKRLHYTEAIEERIEFFKKAENKKYYKLALLNYSVWLLAFNRRNPSVFKERKDIKQIIEKKRINYISLLLNDVDSLSVLNKIAYKIALIYPNLIGFFAFHLLFRGNIVSRIASSILGYSLIPKQ